MSCSGLHSTASHRYLRGFSSGSPKEPTVKDKSVRSYSGVGPHCPLRTHLVPWQGRREEKTYRAALQRPPLLPPGRCPTVHTHGAPAGEEDTQWPLSYKTQGGAWHRHNLPGRLLTPRPPLSLPPRGLQVCLSDAFLRLPGRASLSETEHLCVRCWRRRPGVQEEAGHQPQSGRVTRNIPEHPGRRQALPVTTFGS